MSIRSAITATAASLALLSMPAAAADLPVSVKRSEVAPDTAYQGAGDKAERHRRYRGYRYRNRVDAGDVIAGVAILGGIAAIASAASRNRDNDRYRDRRYPTSYPQYDRSSGLDRAVNQCVREIERDVRVGEVRSVDRTGAGWRVAGTLYNGDGFTCSIGADGRIDGIDYGAAAYGASYNSGDAGWNGAQRDDRQWDDATYAQARASTGYTSPDAPDAGYQTPNDVQPAYPGGPIPGGYQYEDEDAGGYGG